jgi:hypothetical protein
MTAAVASRVMPSGTAPAIGASRVAPLPALPFSDCWPLWDC